MSPELSVVVPTFNNVGVLARNIERWQTVAGHAPIEVIVLEDGCTDGTVDYLRRTADTEWGHAHLRWFHLDDRHELRCTNFGLHHASAPLAMAWQDDMLLRAPWLVQEIVATFGAYPDLGLLCLSRGLNCYPLDEPIGSWNDLIDERRLRSTIGPTPLNWFVIQEVDSVIRPWAVRRACLDSVGFLDEAFVPTEWDEGDLCFRIRRAGWKVATHGYERVGAYEHLGSTTTGVLSEQYKARVLKNGRLFHDRWDDMIRRDAHRRRRTWPRRMGADALWWTTTRAARALVSPRGVGRLLGRD